MLTLFDEKILMICCFSEELDKNKAGRFFWTTLYISALMLSFLVLSANVTVQMFLSKQMRKRGVFFCTTVKPRFSNASVLEQIGFRTINSRFLRFRLRTKIRISTKSKEAERTQMRHDAAYVGFFHTIFGVTELLYFFLLLD